MVNEKTKKAATDSRGKSIAEERTNAFAKEPNDGELTDEALETVAGGRKVHPENRAKRTAV